MKTLVAGIIAALFVAGCAGREAIDTVKEAERLLQTDREFAAASLQHGAADAFRMFLAGDAVMFSDGRQPVHGRDSIYEIMKPGDSAYVLEWTPRSAEVAASGEMGWTWGEYIVTSKDSDGNSTKSYGKYLNVWNTDSAGNWKVVADIGNSSPSPSP
jgi:ketosteroid isomerase-like protein